jgi:hypothetical protein
MRHIPMTLIAVVLSLTLAGTAQAQHGGGGGRSGGGSGQSGSSARQGTINPGRSGTATPGRAQSQAGRGTLHSYYQRPSHLGPRAWNATYGCWCYWSPEDQCYYYWCAPEGCYYPVSYCPTGRYNYDN